MRYIYSCVVLLLFVVVQQTSFAQSANDKLISGNFSKVPFRQFVQSIESKTKYKFYYNEADFDSLQVSIEATKVSLQEVLDVIFDDTEFTYTVDSLKNVFLLKGTKLIATLPSDLVESSDKSDNSSKSKDNFTKPKVGNTNAAVLVASQENKVYEIGSKTGASKNSSYKLEGYVRDAITKEPIIGAAVFIPNTSIGAVTDQDGRYTIELASGRHTINLKALGFRESQRQVILYNSGQLDILMQSQQNNLKEVVVQADQSSNVRKLQMGVEKLSISSIKKVPTVFGEADIFKVVLTLPGVKSVGEASAGFNVRGGAADQNLILFNDATIYNPSHFFGFFSAFNPEVVKEAELYKGSMPAKFGGRLSSVLDIRSREGNKTKLVGSAGIGLLTSRINIEGPLVKDKTSFLLGARKTYSNWLFKFLPDDSGYKNSKASFYDLNLILDHKIDENNSLQLTGYLSQDKSNLNTDTLFSYQNKNIALKWRHTFNTRLFADVVLGSDQYTYNNYSVSDQESAYELSFGISQKNIKSIFTYAHSPKHQLDFGFSSIYYQLQPGSYQPRSASSLIRPTKVQDEQALESAFFLDDKLDISPKFSVNIGARYSVYNALGDQKAYIYKEGVPRSSETRTDSLFIKSGEVLKTYKGPEFRLSLRYAVTDNFSVKAGVNTQRQYIHMLSNTTAIAPTDIWKLSDLNIKPQYGEQASIGFYKNFFANSLELSTEVYYRRIKDYLDYRSGAVLIMNQHVETDVMNTKGKAYGAEFMLKRKDGKLNGWISYTYSRTLLKADDPTIGEVINKGKYYAASYDKPHDFTFVGNQQLSHRFSISTNVTYSTGRPITIPIGKFYYGGAPKTLFSGRNDYRIPDYFRLDISANLEGNHKLKQLTHNSWTFGVYNLTGRKNPFSIYYVAQPATKESSIMKGYKLSIFGSAIPFVNYNIKF